MSLGKEREKLAGVLERKYISRVFKCLDSSEVVRLRKTLRRDNDMVRESFYITAADYAALLSTGRSPNEFPEVTVLRGKRFVVDPVREEIMGNLIPISDFSDSQVFRIACKLGRLALRQYQRDQLQMKAK
jgi:hypothetical protein